MKEEIKLGRRKLMKVGTSRVVSIPPDIIKYWMYKHGTIVKEVELVFVDEELRVLPVVRKGKEKSCGEV